MYATAAVIADQVKKKTTPNSKKDYTHTHQVYLKANNIFKKYKENENIEELEQNIKMKLQAKAQQLRKHMDRSSHCQQNKLFIEYAKKFYCQIKSIKLVFKNHPLGNKQSIIWC
jgi:hypothetical protein